MDRDAARRLLGVREDASEAELHAAYWALRAHVEERAHRSQSASFRAERAVELRSLDEALRQLAPRPSGDAPGGRAAWALAVAAAIACGALALVLTRGGGSPSAKSEETAQPVPSGIEGATGPAPEPARLVVRANVAGARVLLLDPASGEALAEGPTGEREQPIPAGAYALEVRHASCPDAFAETLELAPGDLREVDATVCAATGFLVVRSNAGGDRVLVDGEARGSSGPSPIALPIGEHRVRVEKPGFEAWSATVLVRAGEETTLNAELRVPARPEPPVPDGAAAPDEPLPPERVQALREGYTGWHTAVRQRMLARWDEDGSGRLDREEEARAIPCSEWRELERSYDQGGLAVPMSRLYGFDGSGWVEGALGFTFSAREAAFARMRECGLR